MLPVLANLSIRKQRRRRTRRFQCRLPIHLRRPGASATSSELNRSQGAVQRWDPPNCRPAPAVDILFSIPVANIETAKYRFDQSPIAGVSVQELFGLQTRATACNILDI